MRTLQVIYITCSNRALFLTVERIEVSENVKQVADQLFDHQANQSILPNVVMESGNGIIVTHCGFKGYLHHENSILLAPKPRINNIRSIPKVTPVALNFELDIKL